jgi:hypothetical protein
LKPADFNGIATAPVQDYVRKRKTFQSEREAIMDKRQATALFEGSRRFPRRGDRVVVRDVALAAVIAAIKSERHTPGINTGCPLLERTAA